MKVFKFLGLGLLILCLCVCCLVACDDGTESDGQGGGTQNEEQGGGTEQSLAKIEGVSLADVTVTYDGSAKSLAVTGTVPTGVSVTYTNNGQTNAGEYSVTASLSGEGYELLTLTAKLVIEKAEITGVSAETEQVVSADGAFHKPVLSGTVPAGVTATYYVGETEMSEGFKNIGTYEVKIVLEGANYKRLELPVSYRVKLDAAQMASKVIGAFGAVPDPWSLLPEAFDPQYHVCNTAPNYANFVNVSNIPLNGIGKQMNVAYGLLNKTDMALSYVNTVMGAMNVIKTLYVNYLSDATADYETFTGTAGGFTFTLTVGADSYELSATVGSVLVKIYANTADESYGATVKLTQSTVLKYTVSGSELLVAMDILDVSATQLQFTRDEQGNTVGYLYEFLVVAGKQLTATSAMIEVGEEYTVVIGTKGDFIPLAENRNCEVYDNATGCFVGSEVREDVENIGIFNTYWFPLANVQGITSIKKIDEANLPNADTIYINGYTEDTLHTKLMLMLGGLKKSTSRRFDIEFKTMYFYTYNADTEEYEEVSYEIPMIFIQEEAIDSFEEDFVDANEDALDGEDITLLIGEADFEAIAHGYEDLLPVYDEQKDAVTYESITAYCKQ